MNNVVQYDVGVVGAGPAGLAAALSVARVGLRVLVVGAPRLSADNRTAALFAGSIRLLRNLGAWQDCAGASEPLTAIRLVDDMGSVLRAPEVTFAAAEVGLEALGYNVPNAALVGALRRQVEAAGQEHARLEASPVERVAIAEDGAVLHLADARRLPVRLLVGADGRNSLCRSAAGIAARSWSYDQSALTCTFSHQRPHHGVSTEFHRPAGPLTVVPSPGRTSSLVWVERPAIARRLCGLDEATFRKALEARLQGLLGLIGEVGPRGLFPLSGLSAEVAARNRTALVGEAAHVIPPIGAQGLNLGFRDVAILADCIADARDAGRDIAAPDTLAAYARARRADIATRTWAIDLLNRSLITGFVPFQLMRGLGLHALQVIGPLRRLAIREGLAPSFVTPRLMQGPQVTAPTS